MEKFSYEQKLEAVLKVKSEQMSRRGAAKLLGISKTMVNRWVDRYEQLGEEALRETRRKYDGQFKIDVVEYMQSNHLSFSETAAKFGVAGETTIREWENIFNQEGAQALFRDNRGRKKMLKTEQPSTKTTVEKVAFVAELRHKFKLSDLLNHAELPRSTFYYHIKKVKQPDKYSDVKHRITEIYHNHKGRYGYRRITLELRRNGITINHKTIQRLMKTLGLKSIVRVKKYRSYRGEVGKVAPNILNRNFETNKPNTKWVTDVTVFSLLGQKVFLSPILDLYNGEIVSYEIMAKPAFSMVARMVETAAAKLGIKDKPLLHSDQGWQYQMKQYQHLLQKHNIIQSMSRRGNCLDNAVMENFFGILKSEFFYDEKFDSMTHFIGKLHEYIYYYNNDRIKVKLKGLSPVEYRTHSFSVA
jgi:Transposase and inactivated derivatives